jgi:hypothetical protein
VVNDHTIGYMTSYTSNGSTNNDCSVGQRNMKEMVAQKTLCVYDAEMTIRQRNKLKMRF